MSMNDIDSLLARLAIHPVPGSLDGLEADVLARISSNQDQQTGLGFAALAAIAAAFMGVAGASVPVQSAQAATLSPFGPDMPLAPSTLLTGSQ